MYTKHLKDRTQQTLRLFVILDLSKQYKRLNILNFPNIEKTHNSHQCYFPRILRPNSLELYGIGKNSMNL
jgi:hypothetical protein